MSVSFFSITPIIALIAYIIGFSVCCLKVFSLKRQGYNEMQCKDCLNPMKWLSFIVGFTMKFLIPKHVFEQLVLRIYDEECRRECYNSEDGRCVECGCDAIAKAYSPQEQCSRGNWGPIIFNERAYRLHRKEYPISIKIKYGK